MKNIQGVTEPSRLVLPKIPNVAKAVGKATQKFPSTKESLQLVKCIRGSQKTWSLTPNGVRTTKHLIEYGCELWLRISKQQRGPIKLLPTSC